VRDWWLTKIWSNGAWENWVQAAFTYDIYGDQLSQLGQTWENSAWKNATLESWTYDEQGHQITHTSAIWDGSAWSVAAVDTEMYNANGEETSSLYRNLIDSAWVNSELYTYTYDAQGNETTDLTQSWSGGAWVNSSRWTFTYDANGYYVNALWELWSNGAWVNYGRSIITNDANGREVYSLQQAWNNGAWVNYGQDAFTYDGNDRKATDLYDTWTNNAWVHSKLNSFTYDVNGNKTDELEQAWEKNAWEKSAWYIDSWEKVSGMKVTKPAAAEVLFPGDPYTITWLSVGPDVVHIEASLDGGATYQRVATSVPAAQKEYTWKCSDTVLSAKCRIRLVDASDSTNTATSDLFKIHGYVLTRFNANGDYEAFDPQIHGWQFKNNRTDMWPQSWWQQFSYFHKPDPITGQPYNNEFYFETLGLADSNFVDWPLFVRLFGRDSCYKSVAQAVYSPLAVRLWNNYKDPGFRGACFGFAVSSILAFEHPTELLQAFPEIGAFQNLHDLPPDSLRRRVVNELYESQYGYLAWQEWQSIWSGRDPRMTLEELKSMLFSDAPAHRSLGIFDRSGGHEVTPYRLQRDATTGLWNLYVYDCNCPSADCHGVVYIDSLHDSWQYDPLSWMNIGWGLCLHPDPLKYLAVPSLWQAPGVSSQVQATSLGPKHIQATSYVRLFNSDASITITNATGQTAGFYDSTMFNGFSDGIPIIPVTGMFHRPIGYYVPSGVYSARMYAFAESTASFSACEDSRMFTCWRAGADKSQTDLLTYNKGLAIGNPDQQTKNLNLECITKVGSAERVFQVTNCPAVYNDSLSITAPDVDRLTFVNRGPQKTYGLNIELAGSNGLAQFTHAAITMPANSTHYILPDWLNLPNQPVKIYEDIGNTGMIHDTLTLANQITGIEEQFTLAIPHEFRLEQNFPNPFNPSTTIRYGLPVRSHVSVTVYNALGQQVAVLQNGEQEAGYHDVKFDGSHLGSGVYFYRIEAGPFVQTRKLLLIK
jgi:hypothetical protein